ncbi:hypothetical protein BVY01_04875, partial [bacterium I07]
ELRLYAYRTSKGDVIGHQYDNGLEMHYTLLNDQPINSLPFKRMETESYLGKNFITWENDIMKVEYNGRENNYDFNNWTFTESGTFLPPQPPVSIRYQNIDNSHILMSFPAILDVEYYNVYRDTFATFTPDTLSGTNRIAAGIQDQDLMASGIQWIDSSDVIGNAAINYYYSVTSYRGMESLPSDVMGVFDFRLITTDHSDFNAIALPLDLEGLSTADQLVSAIFGCTSVAHWNAEEQGYEQYIPGLDHKNFQVSIGKPYLVNVSQNSVFTSIGRPVDSSFQLRTTSRTSFNNIMIPHNKYQLQSASDLLADIPNCNSVARWNAETQSYDQFNPADPGSDFKVLVGHAYLVSVAAESNWPVSSVPKAKPAKSRKSNQPKSSQAPHLVCGRLDVLMSSEIVTPVFFNAYITDRPSDRISNQTPGCRLSPELWTVQCASFEHAWQAGETVQVEFYNSESEKIYTVNQVLSWNPIDWMEKDAITTSLSSDDDYLLGQNYPNPFNSTTYIRYRLSSKSEIKLLVLNVIGQELQSLEQGVKGAGDYMTQWDGKNQTGLQMPSGVYFIQLMTGSGHQLKVQTRKILLIQ